MDVAAAASLAESLLARELPVRWAHVRQVAATAARLAGATGLPYEPVVSAAWLHDIGYAAPLRDCGFHPIDGARHLRRLGWHEDVVNLVAHHTCAVVEAGRRGLADVLATEFADVPGLTRDVLWAADSTTGPDGTSLTLQERVEEVVERYGAGSLVADCMITIQPALAEAIARVSAASRPLA